MNPGEKKVKSGPAGNPIQSKWKVPLETVPQNIDLVHRGHVTFPREKGETVGLRARVKEFWGGRARDIDLGRISPCKGILTDLRSKLVLGTNSSLSA